MRYLRIAVMLVFLLSLGIYAGTKWNYERNHDFTMPVITSETELLELSVSDDPSALLAGLSAWDEVDGDLTGDIVVAGTSFFLNDGTCKVKYAVFDSSQNSATLTRYVCYTDYTPPVFSLKEPLVYAEGDNIRYLDLVKAQDVLDGDISERIRVVNSNVSNYESGQYPVVLEVSNSYGDRQTVEVVVVVNQTANVPVVHLKEYITYVSVGETFTPRDLIRKAEAADGTPIDAWQVRITGSVDTQKAGCYQLAYSVSENGVEGTVFLAVVVTEE